MSKRLINDEERNDSRVSDQELYNVILQCCSYEDTVFLNCSFSDVEFEGVWLVGASFEKCSFYNCIFYDVQAVDAKFVESKFVMVEVKGCNFHSATFRKCEFEYVVFSSDNIGTSTDLMEACFEEIEANNVEIKCADIDQDMQLPQGFKITGS